MKYIVRPWACLALAAIFGGILTHALPTLEIAATPKYESRPAVGKLTSDRYAAVARMYGATGTTPEEGAVAVEAVDSPVSEATVSPNVVDEAKPSSGNKKMKLRSAMINNNANDRETATLFKELPFEKNKTITFKVPLEEIVTSVPSSTDESYAPAYEVPSAGKLTDESDKPKVIGVTFKGDDEEPNDAPPPLPSSPPPSASTSENAVNEEAVPSEPSTTDESYSPVYEVPLGYAFGGNLTDESDKPKVVGVTFKRGVVKRPVEAPPAVPNYRSRLAASEVPSKNPDPVDEEVLMDYNVKRRPAPPIPTFVTTATSDLSKEDVANDYGACNKNADCGAVPKMMPEYSTVYKKKRAYNASNIHLRSLPDIPVELDSPVDTLPVEPPYANKDMFVFSAGSNPSSKDSRFPNGEPIYDVIPFDTIPREVTPPPSGINKEYDWFRNEKPSPFKHPNRGKRSLYDDHIAAAGPEIDLEEIVSDPDTRKPPSRRTDDFTEKFTEGVEKASHGISSGLKTFGSYASKKAKATKHGLIKVGSAVGCALSTVGDCGKYFVIQVRRTTGNALARLYAKVAPKK